MWIYLFLTLIYNGTRLCLQIPTFVLGVTKHPLDNIG